MYRVISEYEVENFERAMNEAEKDGYEFIAAYNSGIGPNNAIFYKDESSLSFDALKNMVGKPVFAAAPQYHYAGWLIVNNVEKGFVTSSSGKTYSFRYFNFYKTEVTY